MTYAVGERCYERVEDWGRLPEDVTWTDVCAVSIGPEDRVHVVCRGAWPLLIFEADGRLFRRCDPSAVVAPHGSHVEPDGNGGWKADMSPVNGPVLGPYKKRSEALQKEVEWLLAHKIPMPVG